MSKSDVIFRIRAEDAQSVAAFARLSESERKLVLDTERAKIKLQEKALAAQRANANVGALAKGTKGAADNTDRMSLAAGRGSETLGSMAKGMGGFLSAAAGIAGVSLGISGLVQQLVDADNAMAKVGQNAADKSKSLRELGMVMEAGPGGQARMRELLQIGAEQGLKPEEAARIVQPIESSVKDKSEVGARFSASARLVQSGVAVESASELANLSISKGLAPGAIEDMVSKAAYDSQYGPSDFARGAQSLGLFSGVGEGLAITTGLSTQNVPVAQLPTALKDIALMVGPSAENTDFVKKFGLQGLSETEAIAKLAKTALETGDQSLSEQERLDDFANRVLTQEVPEKERAISLGRAVKAAGLIGETRAGLAPGQFEGFTDIRLEEMKKDPLLRAGVEKDRALALLELSGMIGPRSDEAREVAATRLARGQQRMDAGQFSMVDIETGEENMKGRSLRAVGGSTFLAGGAAVGAGGAIFREMLSPVLTGLDLVRGESLGTTKGELGERWIKGMEEIFQNTFGGVSLSETTNRLSESIEENTQALRENREVLREQQRQNGKAAQLAPNGNV